MQSSPLSQAEAPAPPAGVARGPVQEPPPQAPQPVLALHSFIAAVSAGELSTAAARFTREGCLITPDGTAVYGRPSIAGVLKQLAAQGTQIEVEQIAVRGAGDVAFASGRLTMRSDGPEETRFTQSCTLNLVLRRIEAEWKIAILAPWGAC